MALPKGFLTNAVFYIGTGSHHLLQLNTLSKTPRAKSYTRKALLSWLEKQGWFRLYSKEKKRKEKKTKREGRKITPWVGNGSSNANFPTLLFQRERWPLEVLEILQWSAADPGAQPPAQDLHRKLQPSWVRWELCKTGTSHGKLAGALDLSRTISAGWKLSFSSQLFRTRTQDMVPLGCNEGTSIFLPKQSTEMSISFNIILWKRIRGPAWAIRCLQRGRGRQSGGRGAFAIQKGKVLSPFHSKEKKN